MPTGTEEVTVTLRTAGWSTSVPARVRQSPVTTVSTPGGRPASAAAPASSSEQ